jgi:signal transduction histidine kinase
MHFIDDILEHSQLYQESFTEKAELFNLENLINDLIILVSPMASLKKLDIKLEYATSDHEYYGDVVLINRILLNLISNAIKFTETGFVRISVAQNFEEQGVVIQIEDSGIGIDETELQMIFEPFYRIKPMNAPNYSGAGLGLSSVLLMLKKIHGRIIVQSVINVGSTFSIFLPLQAKRK